MMQKEIFKEYSNIFYPEGSEIIRDEEVLKK